MNYKTGIELESDKVLDSVVCVCVFFFSSRFCFQQIWFLFFSFLGIKNEIFFFFLPLSSTFIHLFSESENKKANFFLANNNTEIDDIHTHKANEDGDDDFKETNKKKHTKKFVQGKKRKKIQVKHTNIGYY